MKARSALVLFSIAFGSLSCTFNISTPGQPSQEHQVATVVAATMQALTAMPGEDTSTPSATEVSGNAITLEQISLVIPSGLAGEAVSQKMTAVETNDIAPWDIAPTYLRFTLTGYEQEQFHEPRIHVYPAAEYARVNAGAAEQMDRLRKILAGSPPMLETLPGVPFFHAAPQIAAHIKVIPFESGSGIRALTQYAQYAAPINNRELFYHFQGLTDNGESYLIAILPITAPILAEDENPDARVPEGGVPIPTDLGPTQVYYFSVTEKLNSLAPGEFTPSLNVLDALIQSISVKTQ